MLQSSFAKGKTPPTDFMVQFHDPVCEIRIAPGLEPEFVQLFRETIVVKEQWVLITVIRD
jgi:hypothetical protein